MKTRCFRYALFIALAIMLLAACGQTIADRTQSPFRITLTYEAATYKTRAALDPLAIIRTREADFFKTKDAYTPPPPTPTPLPPTITPAIPASVRSICLNVDQTFGEFSGPFLPAKDIAARILQSSNYSVMGIGGNCDATLDIQLILWPLSEKYSNLGGSGSSTCYTGAKATGSASMTLPGKTPQTIELLQVRPPTTGMFVIISTCPAPSKAPFTHPAGRAVLQALTELVGPQTLISAVKDVDAEIRSYAILDLWVLYSHQNYPLPRQVMLEALDDPSSSVRNSTVIVLGQIGKEADFAFDKLVSMLKDPEPMVRAAVVGVLDNIKHDDPALIDPYLTALKDPEKSVYSRALSGLGQLEASAMKAVPDILTFYETHPNETYEVKRCLRKITGQDLGDDRAAWRTWWEQRK